MKTYILIINGELVPITKLYDILGDEIYDWDKAYTFVAGPFADGTYLAALCKDFRLSKQVN